MLVPRRRARRPPRKMRIHPNARDAAAADRGKRGRGRRRGGGEEEKKTDASDRVTLVWREIHRDQPIAIQKAGPKAALGRPEFLKASLAASQIARLNMTARVEEMKERRDRTKVGIAYLSVEMVRRREMRARIEKAEAVKGYEG